MADLIAEARFPAPKYRTEGFFTKFEDITTADLLAFAAQNDIKGDHIEVTTVKTADSISIELNKVTRDILEKYNGNICTDKIQFKWELVGTHTGHSDFKAMKPYIDIVDFIKASSMTK